MLCYIGTGEHNSFSFFTSWWLFCTGQWCNRLLLTSQWPQAICLCLSIYCHDEYSLGFGSHFLISDICLLNSQFFLTYINSLSLLSLLLSAVHQTCWMVELAGGNCLHCFYEFFFHLWSFFVCLFLIYRYQLVCLEILSQPYKGMGQLPQRMLSQLALMLMAKSHLIWHMVSSHLFRVLLRWFYQKKNVTSIYLLLTLLVSSVVEVVIVGSSMTFIGIFLYAKSRWSRRLKWFLTMKGYW